jgi:hypothetical protein
MHCSVHSRLAVGKACELLAWKLQSLRTISHSCVEDSHSDRREQLRALIHSTIISWNHPEHELQLEKGICELSLTTKISLSSPLVSLIIPRQLLRPIPRTTPRARQPAARLIRNIRAQELTLRPSILLRNIDICKRQVLARRRSTAMDAATDIIPAGSANILPADVRNADARGIAVLPAVNTRRDVDRLIDVREADVLEEHVLDVPGAGVRLDPRGVGAVRQGDVVEGDVFDEVGL